MPFQPIPPAGDLRNALHVADMLQAAGLKMDTLLYTTLISGGGALGFWQGGSDICTRRPIRCICWLSGTGSRYTSASSACM